MGVDWSAPRPRGTVVARIRCHRAALAKTRWGDGTLATLAGRDSALLKTTPRYPQTQIRIPLGLPKNPRIYEGFCHLERFRLPIGRRALNWHASLCVNGATAQGVQVPRTSEIEGTCCAAPLQRRRHGGRTDCGSSDRCRDPSVVRSSDSRVTPPKNDLRSELARPRTSGPRILTARKHLRRT